MKKIIFLCLMLAICTLMQGIASAQTGNDLDGTSWTLSWMEGGYNAPITIEFGVDQFSGRFFCNDHSSGYELRDGQIVITGDWTQTFAYCIDEDAIIAERTITGLLSGTPRYSLTDDGMLILSDGTGAEIATFMPNATESIPLAVTLSEAAATSITLLTWVSFAMLLAMGTFIINRKQTNKS